MAIVYFSKIIKTHPNKFNPKIKSKENNIFQICMQHKIPDIMTLF